MVRQTMTTSSKPARPRRPAPSDRPHQATTDDGQRTTDNGRKGFTLVELLVVIIVLAILTALLLPAINGALRTARNSAVSAEINQLAQALEQFKSKYGDYPPSRVLLVENGNYSTYINSNVSISSAFNPNSTPGWTPAGGTGDITVGLLASRTLAAFRKIWPRVQLSTNGSLPPNVASGNGRYWYDFNGDGALATNPYILQGHECLVFFLGGIPLPSTLTTTDPAAVQFGMTGFGKDPANPFTNSIAVDSRYSNGPNPMYSPNRLAPFYEFNAGRLFLDPTNPTTPWIPGYYDTINTGPPGTGTTGFFAYFSAYGNGNYDPNDVNFREVDATNQGPVDLHYYVNFPTYGNSGSRSIAFSPGPNPYTTTLTAGTPSGTVTYQKPQSFQIISSGADGFYGIGGQYAQAAQSSSTNALTFDSANTYNEQTGSLETDKSIRQYEYDNLTNFTTGRLQ